MQAVNYILQAGNLLTAFYLVLPLLMYVLSTFRKFPELNTNTNIQKDFAVVITAYKECHLLQPLVDSLNSQEYDNYHIYLVADSIDTGVADIAGINLTILSPAEPLNSKVRSIEYASEHFIRIHDAVCILDSDNLVHPGFLREMNKYFLSSFRAVQGKRTYKNTNTGIAQIDSIRDIYYNFYDQQVPFRAGSSSGITGSAMAYESALLMNTIKNFKAHGGFDKVLQYDVVSNGNTIAYADSAVVYDEKTDSADKLLGQRTRWLHSWFRYYVLSARLTAKGVFRMNRGMILFGIQISKPPVFMLLGLSVLLLLANIFTGSIPYVLLAGLIIYAAGFVTALAKAGKLSLLAGSIASAPGFVVTQLVALLHMNRAAKSFIPTAHTHAVTIKEILLKENKI